MKISLLHLNIMYATCADSLRFYDNGNAFRYTREARIESTEAFVRAMQEISVDVGLASTDNKPSPDSKEEGKA